MKERVTLTIEQDILLKIDDIIDGSIIKNRSHAIELLVSKGLGQDKIIRAVILAGGKTQRTERKSVLKMAKHPVKMLKSDIPAALVKVGDKTVLEHNLDLLKKYGIKDVLIVLDEENNRIKDYFDDGRKFGLKINYIEEPIPLGTAGALKLAKMHLKETFVLLNSDELKDIDLNMMYDHHKKNKAMVTMALTSVHDKSDYGVAKLNGNQIVDFVEKPETVHESFSHINSGLYIMQPSIFEVIPEGYCKLENHVFPRIAKDNALFGFIFSGLWFDTQNREKLEKAKKEWVNIK
jgi:NDP-sugar pyrophosphorylase family protein